MVKRRVGDSVDGGEVDGLPAVGGTAASTSRRWAMPLAVAAFGLLVAGLAIVALRPGDSTENQSLFVDEPPSPAPVEQPTSQPTSEPTVSPTEAPVDQPTSEPEPTASPTEGPPDQAAPEPEVVGGPAQFLDRDGNLLGAATVTEVDGLTVVLDPAGTDLVDLTLDQFDNWAPWLSARAEGRLVDSLANDGLVLTTSIDPAAQALAEEAIDAIQPDDDQNFSMTIVAMDPATGSVIAAAGTNGMPTATVRRPLGSLYQMFVASTAMQAIGMRTEDLVDGRGPCAVPSGDGTINQLENLGNSSGTVDTLRNQMQRSSRCAFARLIAFADGGPDSGTFDPASALFPGSSAGPRRSPFEDLTTGPFFSPLEVAKATLMFANEGLRSDAHSVTRVDGPLGPWVQDQSPFRVMSADIACAMTSILVSVVETGTGTLAQLDDQSVAGKTGTIDDFTDAWFVGYTPDLITVVWMGSINPDEAVPMVDVDGQNVTGGSYPAMAFEHFNTNWHADRTSGEFPPCNEQLLLGDPPRAVI